MLAVRTLRSPAVVLKVGGRSVPRVCPQVVLSRWASTEANTQIRRTGLYNFHLQNGAKMVPFAGWEMPLVYDGVGQVASHKHVRTEAGLFDVGHMVQTIFTGPGTTSFLEHLTPSSLSSLPPHSSTLSVLLNEKGGIIDDTVITKQEPSEGEGEKFYVVTNAGRRDRDLAWFKKQLAEWNASGKGQVKMEVLDDWGLVALQGPKAAAHLSRFTSHDLKSLTFGKSAFLDFQSGPDSEKVRVHVARGGYTGEDGFEISIPPSHTEQVSQSLLASTLDGGQGHVQLAGLGARDSLRLEAGMCLYGHDLDESTTPVEAGLSWVIGKSRRGTGSFIGSDVVLQELKDGPKRRRIGLIVKDAPAREGASIYSTSDERIGKVTSGIPSPTLGTNIAMGCVQNGFHKKGTGVLVDVRGKRRGAEVVGMPFVPARYWRG